MRVITTENKPIKLWLDDIEDNALDQAKNLANLPFTFKWVAIMPDCHEGFSFPIGGVLATSNVILCQAVGVDIGCGMAAVKTSLKSISVESLKLIMSSIRKKIPLGFEHHKSKQVWEGFDKAPSVPIIQQELENSKYQLGTLGGGNHFCEIQKDSESNIWIMLHSGSRNFGLKIANTYHNYAKELCEKWYSNLPDKDLSFLPLSEPKAKEYIEAMNFALEFAHENRSRMINCIKESFVEIVPDIQFEEVLDVHHNYANLEHHFGENVIVHRKGAISARLNQLGIIPGSQGTKSYIVRGKGNSESFTSCSHGAGRKMGRKQAQKELDIEKQKQILDSQGIIHSIRNQKDLDEAPGAYKDISVVMSNQSDLVDIVTELSPLAVIKS